MSDVERRYTRTALALMRMALAMLDRAGCTLAAAHLHHAIDTVEAGQDETTMPPHSVASIDAEYRQHGHLRRTGTGEGTGS